MILFQSPQLKSEKKQKNKTTERAKAGFDICETVGGERKCSGLIKLEVLLTAQHIVAHRLNHFHD